MNFAQFQAQDRRLVILKALQAAAQYRANAYLLRRYCEAVGHAVSADVMEGDLAWLHEQQLVQREVQGVGQQAVTVVTATQRGLDVAEGLASAPGVARPQP